MLRKKETRIIDALSIQNDKNMVVAFKALSEVSRYRIFCILAEQPKVSVSDLAEILGLSLPLISQHIKVLEQAGLLQKEREGKKVFPRIEQTNPFVKDIVKTIRRVVKPKDKKVK
jgi:ArsR family transcriptional regulator